MLRYRTGSSYSGTGLVPATAFLLFRYRTDRMPNIPATTVVDGGAGFDIIYLDFAKAFDKVPIKRLLKKVRAHGISGQILQWIESWLGGKELS
jgi:hypothetical protein